MAARLEVSIALLERWLAGQAAMPDGKLVRLLELLDEAGK
jgi:DNA-binding transcriptional regulator YiaG